MLKFCVGEHSKMHNYIFEFEQETLIKLDLNLKEILLLHYMVQFFSYQNIRTAYFEKKRYCLITYKKIIADLPILKINKRQIGRMLEKLESKKVIQKHKLIKQNMYIYIDYNILFEGENYLEAMNLWQKTRGG